MMSVEIIVAPSTDGSLVWKLKLHSLISGSIAFGIKGWAQAGLWPMHCLKLLNSSRWYRWTEFVPAVDTLGFLFWTYAECIFVLKCLGHIKKSDLTYLKFRNNRMEWPKMMVRNGKLWFENLQSHFEARIAWNVPHFAALLCSFFIDAFEVNLDLFPGLTAAAAALSASYDEWLFRSAPIILNSNFAHSPVPLSLNAFPLLPFKGTCFEAYKGPKHWLNHLCRTHHLQGLVAMLTSFCRAPGAPASATCIPAVRHYRGGAEQSSHPCYWAFLSQHISSSTSSVLLRCLPGSTSGMWLFPNARIRQQGWGWLSAMLKGCKYENAATQMWDYGSETFSSMSGEQQKTAKH